MEKCKLKSTKNQFAPSSIEEISKYWLITLSPKSRLRDNANIFLALFLGKVLF